MPVLQVERPLNPTAQSVTDATRASCPLSLSTTAVGVGTTTPERALDVVGEFRTYAVDANSKKGVEIIGDEERLCQCVRPYDRRVAGVLSGAGGCRPGIVLGTQPCDAHRLPLALTGQVYCKVDAAYGAIAIGDLLTTSATQGHAMKAADATRAFGAVLGKALRPVATGTALIPVLVSLQ